MLTTIKHLRSNLEGSHGFFRLIALDCLFVIHICRSILCSLSLKVISKNSGFLTPKICLSPGVNSGSYQPTYLPALLPIHPSHNLSIYISIYLSIYVSIYQYSFFSFSHVVCLFNVVLSCMVLSVCCSFFLSFLCPFFLIYRNI